MTLKERLEQLHIDNERLRAAANERSKVSNSCVMRQNWCQEAQLRHHCTLAFCLLQGQVNDRIVSLESELSAMQHAHAQELRTSDERLNEINADYRKLSATVADKNHVSRYTLAFCLLSVLSNRFIFMLYMTFKARFLMSGVCSGDC